MAVVRITQELIDGVRDNVGRQYIDSINVAMDNVDTSVSREFLNLMFTSEQRQAIDSLPHGTLDEVTLRKLDFSFVDVDGVRHNCSLSLNFLDVSEETVVVPRCCVNGNPKNPYGWSIYFSTVYLDNDLRWKPLKRKVAEEFRKVNSVVVAKDDAMNKVTQHLKGYATLSPALKAYPPLWDLLPDWVKNRHKEIVEKKPRQKRTPAERPDVDLSDVTARIIRNKMKGGK